MNGFHRRGFLGTSLGLGATLGAGPIVLAKANETLPLPQKVSFKPDTLFLTWQKDPTTTMTIQWVGRKGEANGLLLEYSRGFPEPAQAAPILEKPFPLDGHSVFRCELTGLQPGTMYQFNLGEQSPSYRFRTMPAKLTREITFVSGGDCGVGPHTVANNKLAAKQDPSFAMIGGDLAYDNGTSPKTTMQWLREYSANMIDSKGCLIPMVACIGNHEVRGGYGKTRKEAPLYLSLFDGLYPELTYGTLDFGDYLSLVLLDTGHISKIAGEQTDWLDKTLAARVDHPNVFVVNHVPCYPSFRPAVVGDNEKGVTGAGTGNDQRKHWVPLFEKHNVDIVLEHHDHTFKRTHPLMGGLKDKFGVLYLGDGSWGKLRSAAKSEDRPYIAKASTSYHFSVHKIQEDVRYHMAVEESGKIVDVIHSSKRPRKRG